MHKEALATSLRRLRAERGLSLSQLARATGISSSFLSLVEQAQSDITIGRLIRLAEFYDVELADLLSSSRSSPSANVRVLRADADSMIHSDDEGVDVSDLAAGSRWTLVPMLGIYQPGGSVEVNDVNAREAMPFVLSGTSSCDSLATRPCGFGVAKGRSTAASHRTESRTSRERSVGCWRLGCIRKGRSRRRTRVQKPLAGSLSHRCLTEYA